MSYHLNHQPIIFPIPPSTLLTTPLNFKVSNFFRQLRSLSSHSACCTPYTFQFTFTFSLSIGNSLYFHLHDLVSKIPSFLLSRFFRSTSPTLTENWINSIHSIWGTPLFIIISVSVLVDVFVVVYQILSKMFMETFKEKCLRTHLKEKC